MSIKLDDYKHAVEAEQSVLGAMLIDPQYIPTAMQILDKTDFHDTMNRIIFEKTAELWQEDKNVDLVILLDRLISANAGKEAELKKYMFELSEIVPYISNVEEYCGLVKKYAQGRRAADILRTAMLSGFQTGDIAEEIKTTSEKLAEVIRDTSKRKTRTLQEIICDIYDNGEPNKGRIDTGFSGLDNILDGIYPSDLITIAAGTGIGKTAFALNIALNMAKKGKKIMIYTLEMSDIQNGQRMLSKESGVLMSKIKNFEGFTPKDAEDMSESAEMLSKLNIMFSDNSSLKVGDIKIDCMIESDIDVIIVDHIGLMRTERRYTNRTEEMTNIAMDLRALARNLNKPIIALCQLNREAARQNEPEMHNLRDSGEIEQSSSGIIFLWKLPNYDEKGHIGVKVAKNRQGSSGKKIAMKFNPAFMSFMQLKDYNFNVFEPQKRKRNHDDIE